MADKEIPFYNVSSAVGPGCPNKRTDVMLVQFFPHQIYSHPTKLNKPAGPKIAINGSFDGTTAAWIKHYQNDIKNQGRPIYRPRQGRAVQLLLRQQDRLHHPERRPLRAVSPGARPPGAAHARARRTEVRTRARRAGAAISRAARFNATRSP